MNIEKYFNIIYGAWINNALFVDQHFYNYKSSPLAPALGGVKKFDVHLTKKNDNIQADAIIVMDYRSEINDMAKYSTSPSMYKLLSDRNQRNKNYITIFSVTQAKARLDTKTHPPKIIEFGYEESVFEHKHESIIRGKIESVIAIKPINY